MPAAAGWELCRIYVGGIYVGGSYVGSAHTKGPARLTVTLPLHSRHSPVTLPLHPRSAQLATVSAQLLLHLLQIPDGLLPFRCSLALRRPNGLMGIILE